MIRTETAPAIVRDDRSVVTTGTFDGVHLGHQAILRYLVERARQREGVPTVVTFDPHPREVLGGVHVPLLTTLDERAERLAALGVERFVVLPFTRDLSLLDPEAYIEDVLLDKIGMQEIVIGYDHRFGRGRAGGRETLEAVGAERGFTVDTIPEQSLPRTRSGVERDVTVSSSEIRRLLLEEGDAKAAAALLGRPYRVSGTVVRGDARGRTIGFPTANVLPSDPRKLIPRLGVYAVRAAVQVSPQSPVPSPQPPPFSGMMNVGRRPTFEADGAVTVEVHLFDVAPDLYGRTLAVDVVDRLRDERRFDGVDALVAQLGEDREQALEALRADGGG